jgi:hypothetical protein
MNHDSLYPEEALLLNSLRSPDASMSRSFNHLDLLQARPVSQTSSIKLDEALDFDAPLLDRRLHFAMRLPERESNDTKTRLIRITRPFRIRWDLMTMMVALYNCITVPLIVTFEVREATWITVINNFADVAFIVDIGLNFFTTYINSIGEEVTDLRKIALHYLRLMFWIDLVSAIPFDLLLLIFSSSLPVPDAVNLTDMLKLVRVFRLNRMIRFLRSNGESKSQVRLLIMLTYLMLWIHFAGCAW